MSEIMINKTDMCNEVRRLVSDIYETEKTVDLYCELILQMFMKQSTNN